ILMPLETDGGVISGTVTTTEISFAIDHAAGRITIDGETEALGSGDALHSGGELYLAPHVIEKIVPVTIEFDFSSMSVRVEADGPLPIQVRRRQEQLRKRVLEDREAAVEPLVHDVPYAMFSPPTGDVNVRSDWSKSTGLGAKYDALVGAEIGYLTTQLYVSGDHHTRLAAARLRAGREHPGGGVFGYDGVTEAWAGDVRQPVQPLTGGGGIGRGVLVSTFPLDRPDTYQDTTIDGDAQPGWDVELYHNGLLLGFERVGQDGRYKFKDVPLFYGINQFRLVFYGPQGQLREEERTVTIGGNLITLGKTLWSAFVGQPRQHVLEPLLPAREASHDPAFTFEAARGFTDTLSGNAFVTRAPAAVGRKSDFAISAGVGAQVQWNDILFAPNVAVQEHGGYAADLGVITTFHGLSLSARYAMFRDFRSVEAGSGSNPLRFAGIARVRKSMDMPLLGATLVGVRGEHHGYVDGRHRFGGGLDMRHRVGMTFIDHKLDYRLTTSPGFGPTDSLIYRPTVSLLAGPFSARGAANVVLKPGTSLESLAASARYRIDERSSAGAGISHALESGSTNVNASYSREFDFGYLSGNGSWSDDGEIAVGVGLTFSFGARRSGRPFATSQRLADAGALAPFIYYDTDGNSRFDAGIDTPLPDVGVRLDNGRRPKALTDAGGNMIIGNASLDRPMTIDIDPDTLADPFWTSAAGPLSVQPRRGRILQLELAVVDGGEIAGTVTAPSETDDVPVGGVLVRLNDGRGRQVAEVRTMDDGFYLFERLPPGAYSVEIVDGQTLQDIEIEPATLEVTLPPGGEVLDGTDMKVALRGTLTMPSLDHEWDDEDVFGGVPAVQEEAP
ncbi:MAG: SdrD B-like domain-containing protein, partial [Hyphomicrobiales bacterium]